MKPTASLGSLPLLVADLADEASRDFLHGVALAEQVAHVPLLAAPVDRSRHALEVYSPGSPSALHLLADPVGPPTAEGFPLRLSVRQEGTSVPAGEQKRPPTFRARHETNHELTREHTADLEGEAARVADGSSLVGRVLADGKLAIESLIGGGGVGAVFRARHRQLQMPVAVKVLHDTFQADADFGRRFHAEALAASRLDHPNVTRVLDFGQEPDGLLYLVMEYLDGAGLRALLDQAGRFDTERIVRITSQVCAGLGHAHARSIVHKDVKPENLVVVSGVDDDGNAMEIVKVCDFGIAQSGARSSGADEPPRFQGTPEYMSPEQCLSGELDARSDVYSLGMVMYELATGDVPFTNADIGRIVHMHLHEAVPPPSTRARVDPRLERIILRAVAKDRDARFGSMRDLRSALRDLLEKAPISVSGQFPGVLHVPPHHGAPHHGAVTPSGLHAAVGANERRGRSPEWLLQGGSAPSGIELDGPTSPRPLLTSDPSAFMRRLVETTDPRAFAELVGPLDATIRELAQASETETMWRLASTLDVLATEGPETPGSRASTSRALLRTLRDPTTLAPIALRVLATGDVAGQRLITAAGAFGAHALYSARVRHGDPDARARFTVALRAMGPAALPILRGGLERLIERLTTPGAAQIAEDLLASIPAIHDEELGSLLAAYTRGDHAELVRGATAALPAVWGERSRAIVLGLLDHADDEVAIASLIALDKLGITDEHTPRRVAGVLDRATRRTLRLSAIRTLTHTRGEARRTSAGLLEARVRQCGHVATSADADVAIALARGVLTLAVDHASAVTLIGEAANGWPAGLLTRAELAT